MEHDMELISLWASVESRLKMLDIITVRVITVTELILQLTINISSLWRELCRVDFDAMGNALRDMSWSTCEINPGVMGRQSGWRHEQEAIKPAQTKLSLACCVFTSALCETVLVLFGVVCQYWITQKWRASF